VSFCELLIYNFRSHEFLDEVVRTSSDELETYIQMPFAGIIKFWNEQKSTLPNLHRMQQKHHATPATSSAIECSFSCTSLLLLDRRNRLQDELFEQMLVSSY